MKKSLVVAVIAAFCVLSACGTSPERVSAHAGPSVQPIAHVVVPDVVASTSTSVVVESTPDPEPVVVSVPVSVPAPAPKVVEEPTAPPTDPVSSSPPSPYCPKDGSVYVKGSCELDPEVLPSGASDGDPVKWCSNNSECPADYPDPGAGQPLTNCETTDYRTCQSYQP